MSRRMVNTLDMREILVSANRAFPDRVPSGYGTRSLTRGHQAGGGGESPSGA